MTGSLHFFILEFAIVKRLPIFCALQCASHVQALLSVFIFSCFCDWNMDTFVFISETALKLDSLVGEVEDAVSSVMSKNLKKNSIPQSPEVITENYL